MTTNDPLEHPWEPAEDTAPDAGEYWEGFNDCPPTEQHCEECGIWLGYNYPATLCFSCKRDLLARVEQQQEDLARERD